VLNLAIRSDLALQPDQLVSAIIDPAQNTEPNGTQHNEVADDGQKSDQELGLYPGRYARDPIDEPIPDAIRFRP
jgi:hypothetical protein